MSVDQASSSTAPELRPPDQSGEGLQATGPWYASDGQSYAPESGSPATEVACANRHPMTVEHAFCPVCGAPRVEFPIGAASVPDPVALPAVAVGATPSTSPTTAAIPSAEVATPMPPTKKRQIVGAAVAVVLVTVLVLVLVSAPKSNGTSPASGISASGGITIASLQSSAESQITGPAPSGFAATGVSSVICNPPSTWAPGKTFTCYAYASNGTGVGDYLGTVEPNDSSGIQQWNAAWLPAAPTTTVATTTTAAPHGGVTMAELQFANETFFVDVDDAIGFPSPQATISPNMTTDDQTLTTDCDLYGAPYSHDIVAINNAVNAYNFTLAAEELTKMGPN